MTPTIRHIRTAARERIERVTRRDFLWGVGGAVAASVAGQGVLDPVTEPLAEAVSGAIYGDADPMPHMRMDLGMEAFIALASAAQKAAWEGIKLNDRIPDSAAGRCTHLAEIDGDIWRVEQGSEVSRILWNGRSALGRMADGPDRTFGRWRAEYIRAASRKPEPTFEFIRAVVDGRVHRYTALVVPGRTIRIVSARDEASPAPVRESTAQTKHPGFG